MERNAGVILSHGLWQRRFGGDPRVVGRSITLNDRATTVVGVLPPSFDFATTFTPASPVDMIVPFPITPETDRWGNTLAVLARLKPGVSIRQAQAELDVINDRIRRAHPEQWPFGAKVTGLQDQLTGRFRRALLVLLSAVGAVLVIACANLSSLLLVRAAGRRKEVAIRSALGAGRWRLVRQMLTESLFIGICGAALGIALAFLPVHYVGSIRAVSIPLLRTVGIDITALLFALAAALATGFLCGIVPALQISGSSESAVLGETGRGLTESRRTAWMRTSFVVSEIALACVLLAGAGLLIRSFLRVLDVDLGFRPDGAAAWRIETGGRYSKPEQLTAFYDRLVHAVEAVPGVESAGITDALPLSRDRSWGIFVRGVVYRRGEEPDAHPRLIDSRYIRTMRIPLLAGRDLSPHDTAQSEKVVLLNEKAARLLWPGQDPVGRMVVINGDRRVVGVVGNVRHQALEEEGGLEAYLPITQVPNASVELVIRSKLPLKDLVPGVRTALRSVDPSLPTAQYQALGELVDRAVSPRRFLMLMLGGFASAALILASIGIYGVVSYTVARRTPEIGIRMALGASAGQVLRSVLTQTVVLASCGIAMGLVGALVAGRVAASLLFGLAPTDLPTFSATVVVLVTVALLAGYFPARRASRVDPALALRPE